MNLIFSISLLIKMKKQACFVPRNSLRTLNLVLDIKDMQFFRLHLASDLKENKKD